MVLSKLFRHELLSIINSRGVILSSGKYGLHLLPRAFAGRRKRARDLSRFLLAGTCAAISLVCAYYSKYELCAVAAKDTPRPMTADSPLHTRSQYGHKRPDLPDFTREQVAQHCDLTAGVWVSYKRGVYDVTQFVTQHPGGDAILMSAGAAVDPFWALYAIHHQPHVLEILEKFRIGNLIEEDYIRSVSDDGDIDQDIWRFEPVRHPALKANSTKPFNAEPSPCVLDANFITPAELFYVRNHLPVPTVDPETYRLEFVLDDARVVSFSLHELRTKFKNVSVTSTVMCAGNRRSEMNAHKTVKGLSWGSAAVGNAVWTGVYLSDVMRSLGYEQTSLPDHTGGDQLLRHVCFEGLDTDIANNAYGASIPLYHAVDRSKEVLLAFEMNGETLSRDHGFPLRLIVPGVVGARNVKWLGRIFVSDEESESHWQRNDYKGFNSSTTWETVDYSRATSIQELPVTSAFCSPADGQVLRLDEAGRLNCSGYAWSGGGRSIIRVDVSTDGGKSWHEAVLDKPRPPANLSRDWSWTLWRCSVPCDVTDGSSEVQLVVKAVDSSYNVQPENVGSVWNLRGVLSNAYHRLNVTVVC